MAPVDVLLVEDHTIVRNSLRAMLERTGEFRIVGEVENGAEAVQFCRSTAPHVVLMDLSMPVLNGVDATAELARHCPATRVIVLSAFDDEKSVVDVIRAGAKGYLLKRAGVSDLMEALRTVASGGSYLSPQISNALFTRLQSGDDIRKRGPIESLSPRESQVMRLIARGMTSKEIARARSRRRDDSLLPQDADEEARCEQRGGHHARRDGRGSGTAARQLVRQPMGKPHHGGLNSPWCKSRGPGGAGSGPAGEA